MEVSFVTHLQQITYTIILQIVLVNHYLLLCQPPCSHWTLATATPQGSPIYFSYFALCSGSSLTLFLRTPLQTPRRHTIPVGDRTDSICEETLRK